MHYPVASPLFHINPNDLDAPTLDLAKQFIRDLAAAKYDAHIWLARGEHALIAGVDTLAPDKFLNSLKCSDWYSTGLGPLKSNELRAFAVAADHFAESILAIQAVKVTDNLGALLTGPFETGLSLT